jgi:phospholipid transport system substrate-binding protein
MNVTYPTFASRFTKVLFSCFFSACVLVSSNVTAQTLGPLQSVQKAVDSILSILRTEGVSIEEINDHVRAEVAQAFDSRAMAQSVLSTNWRAASEEQQNEFESLFAETLENTYIGRLEAYTNETVEYLKEEITNTRSTVDTLIVTGSVDIPIGYKLRLRSDGWYVYDVEVENISMVSSYRDTYRSIVRRSGMDGLINQMREQLSE